MSGQSEVEVPHLWAPLNTYVHIHIRLTGTTWSVVVTVVVLLRVQTVQYSGSRAGGVRGRGGGFVREEAATRCLP